MRNDIRKVIANKEELSMGQMVLAGYANDFATSFDTVILYRDNVRVAIFSATYTDDGQQLIIGETIALRQGTDSL